MHSTFRRSFSWITAAFIGLFGMHSLRGQSTTYPNWPTDTVPNRGFYPGGSYSVDEIATVNNTTGNLTISIPVGKLPPGRGGSSFALNLTYNSTIYDITATPTTVLATGNGTINTLKEEYSYSSLGGWRYQDGEYALGFETRRTGAPCTNPVAQKTIRTFIMTADGSRRYLRLKGYNDNNGDGFYEIGPDGANSGCVSTVVPPQTVFSYETSDGSYIRAEINVTSKAWTIFLPEGTQVYGTNPFSFATGAPPGIGTTQSIVDRNGNKLKYVNTCPTGGACSETIADDLQRTVTLTYQGISSRSGLDTITWAGNGSTLTTTVGYGTTAVNSSATYQCLQAQAESTFYCPAQTYAGGVTSIVLPAAKSGGPQEEYLFGYLCSTCVDINWGELRSVTLQSTGSSTPQSSVAYQYFYDPALTRGRPPGAVLNPIAQKTLSYTQTLGSIQTPITETTSYSFPSAGTTGTMSTITYPDSSTEVNYFSNASKLVYQTKNRDGSFTDRLWGQNPTPQSGSVNSPNPYVAFEAYTAVNSGGSPIATSGKSYTVDQNGNRLSANDFDWFSPTVLTRTASGIAGNAITAAPSLSAVRSTATTYYTSPTSSTDAFWNPTTLNPSGPTFLRAPRLITVSDVSGTIKSARSFVYDNAKTAANATQDLKWDSTLGSFAAGSTDVAASVAVSNWSCYDGNGNLTQTTDSNLYISRTTFDGQNLYPTAKVVAADKATTTPPPCPTTASKTTLAEARSTGYSYDSSSGLLKSSTDTDNGISTSYTYDLIGRVTATEETATNSSKAVTFDRTSSTVYDDVGLTVANTSDQLTKNDAIFGQIVGYDPLGREQSAVDSTGSTTLMARQYGNPATAPKVSLELTSNPYLSTSDPTMGWTLTTRDLSGQTVTVAHFKGSALPSPWAGNSSATGTIVTAVNQTSTNCTGPATTVTDEAGNKSTSCADGLGRLVAVVDAAGTVTKYTHDAMDNLTGVQINGAQSRSFVYTSLSRLKTATNPEWGSGGVAGSTNYTYDANGNLLTKTDAGNIVTTIAGYDGLGRITGTPAKSYSDGTPSVTYSYDNDTKGTLYSVANSNSTTVYRHDPLGRVVETIQTTAGVQYPPMSYSWSLSGQLRTVVYPSGRTVTFGLDRGDRVNAISGTVGTQSTTYTSGSTGIVYTAGGGLSSLPLGNGVTETHTWNDRQQQVGISAGSLTLNFYPCDGGLTACSNNNGNIWRETISSPGLSSAAQEYRYDNLNRLIFSAETTSAVSRSSPQCSGLTNTWCEQFGYDVYGNRWVSATAGLPALTAETPQAATWYQDSTGNTSNRITGWSYDNAGDVTSVLGMSRSFTYDAENRQLSATINSSTATYSYDGEGRRVQSVTPSGTTTYVYDASGEVAAEYSTAPSSNAGTQYLVTDHLGSTRLLMSSNGSSNCYDYLPFGEAILQGTGGRGTCYETGTQISQPVVKDKFTGKERDAETGLDFFGARYMSSAQGRFTSPDPSMLSAGLRNPQTWNRYSYALNNPLRYVDPNGELWTSAGDGTYNWVDQCGEKQTCYTAIATTSASDRSLVVYGSKDSGDIQTYFANEAGNIDLREVAADSHDANFEIKRGAAGFLSLDNAAGFFNTAEAYHLTFPGDAKLFVTDAGSENGGPLPPHKTHDHGRAADIRYPDEDGTPLQGHTSAAKADVNRVQSLVNAAKDNGFNQDYSARPKDFGTSFAAGHDDHLHLGTTKDRITPPNK